MADTLRTRVGRILRSPGDSGSSTPSMGSAMHIELRIASSVASITASQVSSATISHSAKRRAFWESVRPGCRATSPTMAPCTASL